MSEDNCKTVIEMMSEAMHKYMDLLIRIDMLIAANPNDQKLGRALRKLRQKLKEEAKDG
jgi:pantothenate kinase-related protein Tda10